MGSLRDLNLNGGPLTTALSLCGCASRERVFLGERRLDGPAAAAAGDVRGAGAVDLSQDRVQRRPALLLTAATRGFAFSSWAGLLRSR